MTFYICILGNMVRGLVPSGTYTDSDTHTYAHADSHTHRQSHTEKDGYLQEEEKMSK